jgi:hypothetical protein
MPNFKVTMQDHPLSETHLKKGDKVTYTNEYGAVFPGYTVQGFPTDTGSVNAAYIDSDCYWHAKPFHSLTIEEKPNFLLFEYYDLSVNHLVERAFAYSKPISHDAFKQYISEELLAEARAGIAHNYLKAQHVDLAKALEKAEFKNPRIGISDGSIGRQHCLNVLVELGDELLAFNAGKSWNHLA